MIQPFQFAVFKIGSIFMSVMKTIEYLYCRQLMIKLLEQRSRHG